MNNNLNVLNDKNAPNFEILSGHKNTNQYLKFICAASDAHRDSFGFLPETVYAEFLRNNCVYVLVSKMDSQLTYCGHLIFTQRYPVATIIQMFTSPEYRRYGLATKLINHFKSELTKLGFSSIYASVAEDLKEANNFWQKQQFHIQTIKPGGKTRNRRILRRCYELQSPQLFPLSGINNHNPLGLSSPATFRDSLFLLDLNVLFDLGGPRRKRHENAVSLFQAERLNICKLAVSNEIRAELHRTASSGKLDPMEGLIDILPSFPLKKFDSNEALFIQLKEIVFPHTRELSANDQSDLSHIATAIQHNLTGLITNDSTVLEAGPTLKAKLNVEILSPTAFMLNNFPTADSFFEDINNNELTLTAIDDSHSDAVYSFFKKLNIEATVVASKWFPTGASSRVTQRLSVWACSSLVGYIFWTIMPVHRNVIAGIAIDENVSVANDAARIMLTYLIEQIAKDSPRQIHLEFPNHHPTVRDVAISLGFSGIENQVILNKIVFGSVLTPDSWNKDRTLLLNNNKLKLPEIIPNYDHADQQIPVITSDGNKRFIALSDLETLLSPALFCLPNRPAVITPIQRSFSEPLLGHSLQESFLPGLRASLFDDRHYISASKTLHHFKHGTLMLFYESSKGRGRCAIVAIARVKKSYLKSSEKLDAHDLEHSVITQKGLTIIGKNKSKTITVFDNIFVLPRYVDLSFLRKIGCGSETQLISTNPITNDQFKEILNEAFRK